LTVNCAYCRASAANSLEHSLALVAIKKVVRVERNDPPVRVHDMHARLLHAAHVEVMRVEELHDDDAKNVVVGHVRRRIDQRQAAEQLPQ
jgi:hypothetical protein